MMRALPPVFLLLETQLATRSIFWTSAARTVLQIRYLKGELRPPLSLSSTTTNSFHRFTTRGKVALAFSCLSGILGVIVVAWYGLAPDPSSHPGVERQIAEAQGDSSVLGGAGAVSATPIHNEEMEKSRSVGSGGVRA